jgi:hypothetical protein
MLTKRSSGPGSGIHDGSATAKSNIFVLLIVPARHNKFMKPKTLTEELTYQLNSEDSRGRALGRHGILQVQTRSNWAGLHSVLQTANSKIVKYLCRYGLDRKVEPRSKLSGVAVALFESLVVCRLMISFPVSIGKTRIVGLGQITDVAMMNLHAVFAKCDSVTSSPPRERPMLGHRPTVS